VRLAALIANNVILRLIVSTAFWPLKLSLRLANVLLVKMPSILSLLQRLAKIAERTVPSAKMELVARSATMVLNLTTTVCVKHARNEPSSQIRSAMTVQRIATSASL